MRACFRMPSGLSACQARGRQVCHSWLLLLTSVSWTLSTHSHSASPAEHRQGSLAGWRKARCAARSPQRPLARGPPCAGEQHTASAAAVAAAGHPCGWVPLHAPVPDLQSRDRSWAPAHIGWVMCQPVQTQGADWGFRRGTTLYGCTCCCEVLLLQQLKRVVPGLQARSAGIPSWRCQKLCWQRLSQSSCGAWHCAAAGGLCSCVCPHQTLPARGSGHTADRSAGTCPPGPRCGP